MKLKLHKFAVLGLVIPVFLSAIFCCCLTDSLHAQEPVPSCHSANHKSETPQHTDECGCDRTMAIIQAGSAMDIAVVKEAAFPAIVHEAPDRLELVLLDTAGHSPPVILGPFPLYIKYSVLRI